MSVWPAALHPSEIEWWLETNTITHTSPLSRSTHTLEFPGARWRVSMSFTGLVRSELDHLSGFIAGLRGPAGRVTLGPLQQSPVPGLTSTFSNYDIPIVNWKTASALPIIAGTTMLRGNWFATHVIEAFGEIPVGTFFAVNNELKQVSAPVVGHATYTSNTDIHFTPPLRQAIPLTLNVNVSYVAAEFIQPTSTFRLVDDSQGRALYRHGGQVGDMSVELVEVI